MRYYLCYGPPICYIQDMDRAINPFFNMPYGHQMKKTMLHIFISTELNIFGRRIYLPLVLLIYSSLSLKKCIQFCLQRAISPLDTVQNLYIFEIKFLSIFSCPIITASFGCCCPLVVDAVLDSPPKGRKQILSWVRFVHFLGESTTP